MRYRYLPLLLALAMPACVAKRPAPSPEENPPEVMGPVIPDQNVGEEPVPPEETYGPALPTGGIATEVATVASTETATATSTASATSTATSIATPTTASAKLCLVLGPGMAKAMAEAAVLATLKKAKLPVHCLVGTEMGAVVAALYSFSNGSTNNLQWQLFKLHKDTYFNFPMISLRDPRSTGGKLHEFFEGIFRGRKIEELPIPFATLVVDDDRDSDSELTHGDLSDALSASVAVQGVFDPWKMEGNSYRSSGLTDPLPVELAKKLGGTFLVAVDVLTDSGAAGKGRFAKTWSPARSLMKLQRKEASFVIQVATPNIQFDDFARQGEILAAGTAAAEKALPAIKAAWEKASAGAR